VRAKDSTEAEVLTGIGACHAVPETVESSLQLGAEVLVAMGIPTEAVSPVVEEFRQTTYARLRRPRDAA